MNRRLCALRVLSVLSILCVLCGTAKAAAQSLADVAKKEQERRKTVNKPTKTYTNSDLKEIPPATTQASSQNDTKPAPEAAAANKDKKDTDKDKDPAKDKAYWGGRMKQLQTQLDRDKTYADALQARINQLTADFVNRDDPAQRGAIARDKQKAIDELTRLKQSIDNDKKAVSDLEEEARRAGVPPGWLRS